MLIAHLSKLGSEEILGVIKEENKKESEESLIPIQNQNKVKTLIEKYFKFLSDFLVKEYKVKKKKKHFFI